MNRKKARLIINPISGTHSKEGLDNAVREVLEPLGYEFDVTWTDGHDAATRLAREAVAMGCGSVIAAGGDGTINETARALCDTGVALGIIPCGSGNGLARHIGIPVDLHGALEILAEQNILSCDYGSINGRPFFCTFGSGFDAHVSEKFAEDKKRGKMTYLKNTIREFVNYKPEEYTIFANGHELTQRAFVVAVCNASQYGNNAYIAPHASITDGLLDITIIHYGNLISTALVGIDLMTGFIERNMLIHTLRASEAVIRRKNSGPVHIDGEPMEMGSELSVKCHKEGLDIYVPSADRPFRPLITPVQSMMDEVRFTVERLLRNISI